MDITAKEVLRQSERVETQLGRFDGSVASIISNLNSMASIITSEDSGLASALNKDASQIEGLKSGIDKEFHALAIRMDKYAQETIKNEEEMTQNTEEIDQQIQEIEDFINSLNSEMI